jgi:hypothetical protein
MVVHFTYFMHSSYGAPRPSPILCVQRHNFVKKLSHSGRKVLGAVFLFQFSVKHWPLLGFWRYRASTLSTFRQKLGKIFKCCAKINCFQSSSSFAEIYRMVFAELVPKCSPKGSRGWNKSKQARKTRAQTFLSRVLVQIPLLRHLSLRRFGWETYVVPA